MKINEIVTHKKLGEQATAGATSAGNIATLSNPHVAAGPDRFKKSYTGSPGKSGTKAPNVPIPKMQKPTDNALTMQGVSLFGGPSVVRR
jgi:hypothetical protein